MIRSRKRFSHDPATARALDAHLMVKDDQGIFQEDALERVCILFELVHGSNSLFTGFCVNLQVSRPSLVQLSQLQDLAKNREAEVRGACKSTLECPRETLPLFPKQNF